MTEQELIEQLAEKEHASWTRWMNYLFSKCKQVPFEGTNNANLLDQRDLIIPAAYVEALQKQIDTPYADLPERDKRYDREEVKHILPIIEKYVSGKLTNAVVKTITPYGTVSQPLARKNRQHLDKSL